MSLVIALATAALLSAAPQTAQQPATGGVAPTDLESIIVEGRRVEEAARAYIREVGDPPRGTSLARWNRPVCVSMTNMQPQFAQFVIDRIATNAFAAGADVGGQGCRPNVVILATNDGPTLAKKLVAEAGLGFRPAINHTNLNRDALADFQNSDAPVRWWNVVMPVSIDNGAVAIALRGDTILGEDGETLKAVRVRDASRMRANIRYDMAWTIVIIDMSRTGGVPLGALADYASMVSLAQIDASADLGDQSTVMNLFKEPAGVDGLSQWDRDYLSALYAAPSNRADGRRQENAVARTLIQQRRVREGLDPAPAELETGE